MEEGSNGEGYKISLKTGGILTGLALVFDLLTLIPFVGDFVATPFWIGVAYYFWKKGLGIVNWRRLAPSIISVIAEFIPGVQALPSIFAAMLAIIALTKFQEKTGISVKPTITKGVTPPRLPRIPANINGVRQPRPTLRVEEISENTGE